MTENLIVLIILAVISIVDIKKKIIPNRLVFLIILTAFVRILRIYIKTKKFSCIFPYFIGFLTAFFLCLICCAVLKNSIGMGDIKLLLSLGLTFRADEFIKTVFGASLSAAAFSLVLIVMGKIKKNTGLPFAPFIFIGALCVTAEDFILEVFK